MDLVDVTEIARRAGTSPGMVHQWRRRHADFPAPLVTLAIGPIWTWEPVKEWLDKPRKPGRPRAYTHTIRCVENPRRPFKRVRAVNYDPDTGTTTVIADSNDPRYKPGFAHEEGCAYAFGNSTYPCDCPLP